MLSVGDLVKLAPTLARRWYIVESSLTLKHVQYDSTSSPARHDDMYVVVGFCVSFNWSACALLRADDGRIVWLHASEVIHV
jgi:hypothetical protein